MDLGPDTAQPPDQFECFMIRKRIIVGGLPRSGSSLLRVLLDASQSILSVAETGFFLRPLDQRKRRARRAAHRLNRIFHLDPTFIERAILSSDNEIHCFDRIITAFACKNHIHKRIWAEKSPRNCEHYDRLTKIDPDLYFVSTIRDGRAVVTSIVEGRDTYHCTIERFRNTADRILEFGFPRHLIVRYEDLVDDPGRTLRRVFAFLDESFDPEILVGYQTGSITRDSSLMNQPMVQQPISTARLSSWKGSQHRARIDEFMVFPGAKENNQRLGYATTN